MRDTSSRVPISLFFREKLADIFEEIVLDGVGENDRMPSPDRPRDRGQPITIVGSIISVTGRCM
jgi:hypothetical protein